MNEPPNELLTEPMTVAEVGIFCGLSWHRAKRFVQECDGAIQTSLGWQVPIYRMGAAYLVARRHCSTLVATSADSALRSDNTRDNVRMTQLMTERDTAIALRLSLQDLNALIESGQLPFIPVGGGEIRFDPFEVREAIRRMAQQDTQLPRQSEANECKLS